MVNVNLGDMNINLTTQPHHSLLTKFQNMGLSQLINEVTRPVSNTIIDHIYTNNTHNTLSVSVPNIGLSDHLPVAIVRKHNGSYGSQNTHKTIQYRSYKTFDHESFRQDLQNVPWHVMDIMDEVDDKLFVWNKLYMDIVDKHAPLIKRRVKYLQQPNISNNQSGFQMKYMTK